MVPSSNESDIQLQLHFLDCQPDSINRSLNDQSVMDHLYRAATNQILKFGKSYDRKESDRVTDIDQLSLSLSSVLFIPKNMTRNISIEMTKTQNHQISIPIVKSENKTQSTSSIDVNIETEGFIPPAPPLPSSLDSAIKLQSQLRKPAVTTPDQETLWANMENQNVAEYFDQLMNPINHQYANKINKSKTNTILDARKSYNIGLYMFLQALYI